MSMAALASAVMLLAMTSGAARPVTSEETKAAPAVTKLLMLVPGWMKAWLS